MRRSKLFVMALCLTSVVPAAAFACSADDMVGNWKCGGGLHACVAGHDVSHVSQASDGSWRWTDGLGYEAQITVADDKLTAHYLNGPLADKDAFTASLDSTCHRIAWSPTHQDSKM